MKLSNILSLSAIALTIATGTPFASFAETAYATSEEFLAAEATLWLDASDISTITTNASGEVTQWNSRVGSNYAKQSTHFQGVAMPYPKYDATTYGIPTVDFGEAKTDGGWSGTNLGMDLRLNETVPTKTVFWVARMKDAGNVAWMGINGFDTPFRRGDNGQYAMIPNAKFVNFWNGQDVVTDMANDHPPADVFCVYSAQMDDSATYNAEYLASQCSGLHSGGKQLSELIIFNQALSDGDRIEVTKYLQRKWAKSRTAPIAHRWSFNGTTDSENLTDSVGGIEGKMRHHTGTTTIADGGTVNWTNGKASLPGGNGEGYINLGQGVLGTGNAVTLELWVTKDVNPSVWAYLFAYNKEDETKLITISANLGASNKNNINKIESSVGFNYQMPADDPAVIPLNGTYHYAITFLANGSGGTVVRWVIHDAATGLLKGDLTYTANSWTLADATSWSLTLGSNPWLNNTYEMKASYDEVRVWNGVLGDEQLRVNTIMGPDASPDAAVTSSDGFALATNTTFQLDGDYTTAGVVILGEGSKLQFNGPYVFTALGGISIPSGELADYVVADASLYNVIINGDVITVTCKAGSASWTGVGRTGDVSDPNNWDCRDGFDNPLPGELPSSGTAVTVSGSGVNLQAPEGTTLQCATFTVRSCTFAADCDWRGLPVTPSLAGTADLNGHDLRLSHLTANSGAAIANGGTGISGIVFDATSGNYNETYYVDGLSNLGTSENARIVILKDDGGSLSSALTVGNSAGVWSEYRVTGGTFTGSGTTMVGNTGSSHGILTIDGGAVTLASLKVMNGNLSGSGTVNLKSGSLTVTSWTDYGNGSNGTATFNQSGGTFETDGNFWFGRSGSGTATYNMTDGIYNVKGSFRLGSAGSGKGIFNQSGGTVNLTGTEGTYCDFNLGYDSGTYGKYYQIGGTINTTRNINLRRSGSLLDIGGAVTMTVDGKGVNIATVSGESGEVILREGGVLTTSFIKKHTGTAKATFVGGKIVAKDASNASTFISGIGNVTYAAGGLTVDTAGYNVSMANNTVSNVTAGSALVKQGAGTLTVDSLPPVRNVSIDAGTLKLSSDGAGHPSVNAESGNEYTASPSATLLANNYLLHRWNFNGHCYDLIGTNNAVFKGSGTYSYESGNTEIKIPGGGRGTGWLDCGSNIIPAELGDTPFTIEIWATPRSLDNWRQLFAFGNNTRGESNTQGMNGKGLVLTPRKGASPYYPTFNICNSTGGNDNWAIGSSTLTANREYHFVVTATPKGGNAATVTAYIQDTTTGDIVSTTKEVTDWTTTLIDQKNFWLGHSHWNDGDLAANYNEVRVWAVALSQAQVEANGTLGADTLPVLSDRSAINMAECMDIASGATLDITEHTLTLPVLKGSGAVRGGMLDITDCLVVNLADCVAGNCITASGIIDFTGAKLVFENLEVLETHKGTVYFIRAASDGGWTRVGEPECVQQLPAGWSISFTSNGAKLRKGGISIHLR